MAFLAGLFFTLISTLLGPEPPAPNRGPDPPPELPIDQWLLILILAGLVYGIFVLNKQRKTTNTL